jgi:hypothetical protein
MATGLTTVSGQINLMGDKKQKQIPWVFSPQANYTD